MLSIKERGYYRKAADFSRTHILNSSSLIPAICSLYNEHNPVFSFGSNTIQTTQISHLDMAQRSYGEKELSRSEYKTYNAMPTTSIKREIPINERNRRPDGSYIDDARLPQRFFNEAAAYKLLKAKTSIPVPNVISHGYDKNHRLFLETELIAGTVQASHAASECRMSATHHMTPGFGP